jgi:hypothetical protein
MEDEICRKRRKEEKAKILTAVGCLCMYLFCGPEAKMKDKRDVELTLSNEDDQFKLG